MFTLDDYNFAILNFKGDKDTGPLTLDRSDNDNNELKAVLKGRHRPFMKKFIKQIQQKPSVR